MKNEKHPQLLKKLSLLYSTRRQSSIRSHADLANVLGISRQAISKWAYGSLTARGNRIPQNQLERICGLFQVSESWFELPHDDFCNLLQRAEPGIGDALGQMFYRKPGNWSDTYLSRRTYSDGFLVSANQERYFGVEEKPG